MIENVFGYLPNGRPVMSYVVKYGDMSATVLQYGATLQSLKYKDKEVILGYDTIEEYLNQSGRLGATIGRVANRIDGGKFYLNGRKYDLYMEKGEKFSKHGGKAGFDKVMWEAREINHGVAMKYISTDGEEGYPGTLAVEVRFILKENALRIEYYAISDKNTIVSLTNHSYFNFGDGNILNHFVQIDADSYTPVNEMNIPTGQIDPVQGTPFDLRRSQAIGAGLRSDFNQIQIADGYDHNYVLNGTGFRKFAEISSGLNNIVMDAYTDQEGVQLYTGNGLTRRNGRNGSVIDRRYGICLETQAFPNAINCKSFKSPILKANEVYQTATEFVFYDFLVQNNQ